MRVRAAKADGRRLMRRDRRQWINFLPALSPRLLAGLPAGGPIPAPLDGDRTVLTFSARHAIWLALEALRVKPDETILVPSYCCGAEVLPMIRFPVNVRFYHVRWPMDVDLDHVARSIDATTRALFVTSYVGSPHNLREAAALCRKRGIALIEDCAHSLYGRCGEDPLGTLGDIGIFSMRKTIPVPDGGALVLNNPNLRLDRRQVRPKIWAYGGKTKHLLGLYAKARLGGRNPESLWPIRPIVRSLRRYREAASAGLDLTLERGTFDPRTAGCGISWLAETILRSIDGAEVARRRRQNYGEMRRHLETIQGIRPLLPYIEDGVCPLFFPVEVPHSDAYTRAMVARGVEAIPFWSDDDPLVSRSLFPDAYRLKKSVLAVPIHQDLGSGHLAFIAEALRDVVSEIGPLEDEQTIAVESRVCR